MIIFSKKKLIPNAVDVTRMDVNLAFRAKRRSVVKITQQARKNRKFARMYVMPVSPSYSCLTWL